MISDEDAEKFGEIDLTEISTGKPRKYFNGNPDATQKNCKHGWVLPDRCRYNARLGCDCGEYPPLKWNQDKGQYEDVST